MFNPGSSLRSFLLRNRVSLLSFTAFIGFVALSFSAFSTHSQSIENKDSANETAAMLVTSPSPTPTPHDLVGSFYTVENGVNAKLLLNNKGPVSLEVRPTIYNLAGQPFELTPVWVEAHSFRFINLADWASIGGASFRSGSVKLFHTGKDLVLGAQIYLTDEAHSLSHEEKLAELGKFDSRRQEAVWFQPTNQTETRIVLSNTSNAPLTVTGRLAKAPRYTGNVNTFQLAAHETKILDLRQDFSDGLQFSNARVVGLSLEHAGAKSALLARVGIADIGRGYSNLAQFSNPNGGTSSEYQGVGFQIDEIAGEQLTPVIVAKNVGTQTATVTAKVPYTRENGTTGTINLPQTILQAGELKTLDVRQIVQRADQEQIKIASLEITYTTAPGSVIVAAHSVGENGSLVLRPPMWDPLAQNSPTGGYPWRIEATSTTHTYIKNITDREQDYIAYLYWENGGGYMIGLKTVAPRQTIEINVKDLRDRQVPDYRGRKIPLHVTSGQLQWSLRGSRDSQPPLEEIREDLALLGRTEQIDPTRGISTNYACRNCCESSASGFISPDPFASTPPFGNDYDFEVGDVVRFYAYEAVWACYDPPGSDPQVYPRTTNDWSSNDTNVATVDSTGLVTVQGAGDGEVEIEAEFRVRNCIANPPCEPGPYRAENAEDCKYESAESAAEPSPDAKRRKIFKRRMTFETLLMSLLRLEA